MKYGIIVMAVFSMIGCGKTRIEHIAAPGCHVEGVSGGAVITCPDGSQSVILNGVAGLDGSDGAVGAPGERGATGAVGPSGQNAVIEVIDPCGDGAGFDEVLLVIGTGEIIAYFEGPSNTKHLALLIPGNYRTTDQQACNFRVNNDYTITF